MEDIGMIFRIERAPNEERYLVYADDDQTPVVGFSTRERAECWIETLVRVNLAQDDAKSLAKQATTDWIAVIAARYSLPIDNYLLFCIRSGIAEALDEVFPTEYPPPA
jgi:hypothetical protein